MNTVIDEIAAERRRQIDDEGFDTGHDNQHEYGELSSAAACYALKNNARSIPMSMYNSDTIFTRLWPFDLKWWKPKYRRYDLIRAAALIVAEIERLDRCYPNTKGITK